MTSKDIAQQYFHAWTHKQYERVRALMANDLKWESPMNAFASADEVMPGFKRFIDMVKSAKQLALVADGDDAALLYECEFPFGTVRMTTWLHIEADKIRSVRLTFDPAPFTKAAQAAVKS
jgi:hypothetical protein